MSMTVSISKGRTAILHDIRSEISANVDETLTRNNEIFENNLADFGNNLVAYTDAHFQPYIDTYNVGKKNSRQIHTTYTEHIAKENDKLLAKADANKRNGIRASVRKPTQLAHEYVLQFGNRDNNSTLQMDGESEEDYRNRLYQNRAGLKEALRQIEKKYPHCKILLATYHEDEPNGTPHMHILVQFEGEGYQKGLSHQISMSKALENDGFERSQNRGDYAINRWTKDISDNILAPCLDNYLNQDRDVLGEHRQHEDIVFFREKAKKEAKALQEEREQTQDTLDRLDKEIDCKEEYSKALQDGIAYLRRTQEHLQNNATAYQQGGWFYDYGTQQGLTIPDGGLEKAVHDGQEKLNEIDSRSEAREAFLRRAVDLRVEDYRSERENAIQSEIDATESKLKDKHAELETINSKIGDAQSELDDIKSSVEEQKQTLSSYSKDLKSMDSVQQKLTEAQGTAYDYQISDGFFSKKNVVVVEGYTADEVIKVFKCANYRQATKKLVTKAQEDAQGILDKAQGDIDKAHKIISEESARRSEIDQYAQKVREDNAELEQENRKLRGTYLAYTNGWTDKEGNHHSGLEALKAEYVEAKTQTDSISRQLQDKASDLYDISEEYERKMTVLTEELNPQEISSILSDSVVTNLIQSAAKETCNQLEAHGLLKKSAMTAFIGLDTKSMCKKLVDNAHEFLDKVKEHMSEMVSQVVHHRHMHI